MESIQVCIQGLDFKIDYIFYCLRIYILLPRGTHFLPEALYLLRLSLSVTSYQPKSTLVPGFSWPASSCAIGSERSTVTLLKYPFTVIKCLPSISFLLHRYPHQPPNQIKCKPFAKYFENRQKCYFRGKK